MIGGGAAGLVRVACVDGGHLAGVGGDAAVGEEVGRVGEEQVGGGFWDGGEDVEAVALVEAEVVFGVVEGGTEVVRVQLSAVSWHNGSNRGAWDGAGVGWSGDGFGHSWPDRARRTGKNPCAPGSLIKWGSLIKG